MNKKKALIVFTLFDILAFLIFWLGFHQIYKVILDIYNASNSVSFINRAGIPFIMLGVPFIHLLTILEFFRPAIIKKSRLINRTIIVFGVILFAIAILVSVNIKTYVEKAGYQYCSEASGVSALFKTLVYTKDSETCNQLAAERREKLGLTSR